MEQRNPEQVYPGYGGVGHLAAPGDNPAAYAVYVDETGVVWVSDFGANAMLRFDPDTEQFDSYPLPHQPGEVRQILGRPGEIWVPSQPPTTW